jgi:hypothetical protein
MKTKRSWYVIGLCGLAAILSACSDQPEVATAMDTTTPSPKPLPTQTSSPTPEIWSFQEGWWQGSQVLAQSPGAYQTSSGKWIAPIDYEFYSKAGLSVMSWFDIGPETIQELHNHGIFVVGDDSMITTYRDIFSPDNQLESPPEYIEAAIYDPFGNIYRDNLGIDIIIEGHPPFMVHSMLHPLWQEYMISMMKAYIDAGADGYLIDELADGSRFYPDFNPYTMELFRAYLADTYSEEELVDLLEPYGIQDIKDFDYAALVRDHLPAGMTELTREDWMNPNFTNNIPLINQFDRFLNVENNRAAMKIVEAGREYALETYGIHFPISANIGSIEEPSVFPLLGELDFFTGEFAYEKYDYFPQSRATGTLELAQALGRKMYLMTQLTTRPQIVSWGKANTVNLYRVMIADAVSGGGGFHVESGRQDIEQDLDAIGDYYRFQMENRFLFADVDPISSNVAVLHTWEAVLANPFWKTKSFSGTCNLLSDSGYQYDVIFGAEDFTQWGEMTHWSAPDYPLNLEMLAKYPLIILPDSVLTPNHAELLLDYVEGGGILVVFPSEFPEAQTAIGRSNSAISTLLSYQGAGRVSVGEGAVIYSNRNWGTDYIEASDPAMQSELINLLKGEGFSPEIKMEGSTFLSAQAYTGTKKLVVHFVNYNHDAYADTMTPDGPVEVEISLPEDFDTEGMSIYLFSPGEAPIKLNGTVRDSNLTLTLPEVFIWSVLLVGQEDVLQSELAQVPAATPVPASTAQPTAQSFAGGQTIFDDGFAGDWWFFPWDAEADIGSTQVVFDGEKAIEVNAQLWGSITLTTESPVDPLDYSSLLLSIYIDEEPDRVISTTIWNQGEDLNYMYVNEVIDGKILRPGQWYLVEIPLDQLDPDGLPFDRISIGEEGIGPTTFYIDHIGLLP